GVAGRFEADLDAQKAAGERVLEKLPAQFGESPHEVVAERHLGEAGGEFGPFALADAGDESFLAIEIDVERTRTDCSLAADVLHGRAVETGTREAASRRIEYVIA